MARDYVISEPENNSSYVPLEAGSYGAICYAIIGVGTHYNERFGNSSKQTIFYWEIPSMPITKDGKEKPMSVYKSFTESMHEKSNLRKMLEGWRGRMFTEEERKNFSLLNVLGKPCLLNVIDEMRGERTYSRVSSVSKLPKEMSVPQTPYNETVIFNICDLEHDINDIFKFPKWVQEQIMSSDEYKKRTSGSDEYAVIVDDSDLPF